MPKLSLFIASSREALSVARRVRNGLQGVADVTLWSDPIFPLTRSTLDGLIASARRFDFAVAILTPDDTVSGRGETWPASRANVIFELGLFIGTLGCERTCVIAERQVIGTFFSDFRGITIAEFDGASASRARTSIDAACRRIRDAIAKTGWRTLAVSELWARFAHDRFTVLLPRYVSEDLKDSAGFAGVGDAMAIAELRARIDEWGLGSFDIRYPDSISGPELQQNILFIGGPGANEMVKDALARTETKFRVGRRLTQPVIIDKVTEIGYAPSFDRAGKMSKDVAVIIHCPNPYAGERRMIALFGISGYGTWAAARYATSREFAKACDVSDDDSVECLVEADVVRDAVQETRPIIFRTFSTARNSISAR